jgi:antitoxin MazE
MKTRVQKWGNSLAVRIPKSVAAEAGLRQDSPVELSLVDGEVVIRGIHPQPPSLAQLLRQVTDENIHKEWDTGPPVGREVW